MLKIVKSFGKYSLILSIRCEYSHRSWSNGLNLARVTHWGGMISTPDVALQEIIKITLIENGCPLEITEQLMENAHERHWPEGLATLGNTLPLTLPWDLDISSRNSTR